MAISVGAWKMAFYNELAFIFSIQWQSHNLSEDIKTEGKNVSRSSGKRGKVKNQLQARVNMKAVVGAGKHETSSKRGTAYNDINWGKTCNQWQAREST